MKKYKCVFLGEGQEYIPYAEFLYIEAKSPEHAAKLFSEKIKRKEFPFIRVNYGFLGVSGVVFKNLFYIKSDKVTEVKAEADQREIIKLKEEEKEFKKETEKYSTMTKDEFLIKMIQLQNKQINLFEYQIEKQNEQTEVLNKIRWAIIALLIFIVGQTIVLKMKLGL